MSLRQLNGWRRLWLVASVLWWAWVVLETVPKFPTEKKQFAFWAASMAMDVQLARQNYDSIRNAHSDLSDKQFIEMAPKIYPNVDFSSTLKSYQSDMTSLTKEQLQGIGAIALLVILPPALVYAIGLMIGWVLAGFRKK